MPPDQKRRKRIVNRDAGLGKVAREGRCRVCGKTSPLTRSHIVPKGQGGDDLPVNIIPLCGSGTTGCHGKHEAYDWEVRSKERATFTIEELAYVIARAGEGWLDRQYPKTPYEGGRR